MEFIECSNLSYCYEDIENNSSIKAIDNISFTIKKGEFVSVIGPNGSGKSTLGKLLNGLLKPMEGFVNIKGMNSCIENYSFDIKKLVGIIFQNPDNQLVSSIVEDDVAFGCENIGLPSEEIRKRVDYALKKVGIYDIKNELVSSLSGGQKQRVAIAGILAMNPECIIFDEATAMLDPKGRKAVTQTARELNKEGITIIFITHYMEEVIFSDRILVLSNGKITMEGTPYKVFSDYEFIIQNGLQLPEITELGRRLGYACIFSPQDIAERLIENNINIEKFEHIPYINESNEILRTENISYNYPLGRQAVKNVNSDFKTGELISIIGATGSGKSTFIQLLNGIYKPQQGEVYFKDKSVSEYKNIKQKIGIVFQYPEDQIFESTVFSEVSFAPKNMGINDTEINERVKKALDFVGIPKAYYTKNPLKLSGGEKRRIAIASILSMKPEVLVLDEPLAGLDPKTRKELLDNIINLTEKGVTVIMTAHSMEEAYEISDRIIVMNKGEIAAFDTPYNIFSDRELILSAELDIPQCAKVFDILIEKGRAADCAYSLDEAEKIIKRSLSQ